VYLTLSPELRSGTRVVAIANVALLSSHKHGTTKTSAKTWTPITIQRRYAMADTGISNRESSHEEADERRKHLPADTNAPQPEDAAGRVGEDPLSDNRDRHTSHKGGSRSIAQKEAESRYPDRSMPPTRKVAGAFGREPKEPPDRKS
jgi:hypothetical protein